jgi:hypothetical protein
LVQARSEIAKAIALKPDAHFGRERYQLKAMDWMLELQADNLLETDSNDPPTFSKYLSQSKSETREAAIQGLSGLIVLGAAWESVDVIAALGQELHRARLRKMNLLAQLRVKELLQAGKKPLWEGVKEADHPATLSEAERDNLTAKLIRDGWWLRTTNVASTEAKWRELRQEAETWHKARTAFMVARLKSGRHPDTDPTFWQGYVSPAPPTLDVPWQSEWPDNLGNAFTRGGPLVWFVLMVFGPVMVLVILVSRRLRTQQTARGK